MQMDMDANRGRWAVAAMFGVNGFLMGIWATQIPLLLPRHQISEATLGLLILALGLGAVGSMLFAGRLIAAFGSRRVLIAFALSGVPTVALVVFAPNLWILAPFMAVLGGLLGCMDVAMNANAVLVERRLHRAIMSSSHGFWSLGGFIGGGAGSFALAHWGAQVQVSIATAIALSVVMLAIPFLLRDAPVSPQTSALPRAATVLFPRDAALWFLGLMALFSMIPEGAVLDWAALYLAKELGADVIRAGLGFAGFAGAMAIMRFAGDGMRNRFGAVLTLRASGLMGAAGMMIAALAPNDLIAIAGFAISGIGIANMVPIVFSAAGNHPGLASGAAISTVTMVGYAGILVAPSSIGFIAEHVGFAPTYAALSLFMIAVAAFAGRAAAADQSQKDA